LYAPVIPKFFHYAPSNQFTIVLYSSKSTNAPVSNQFFCSTLIFVLAWNFYATTKSINSQRKQLVTEVDDASDVTVMSTIQDALIQKIKYFIHSNSFALIQISGYILHTRHNELNTLIHITLTHSIIIRKYTSICHS